MGGNESDQQGLILLQVLLQICYTHTSCMNSKMGCKILPVFSLLIELYILYTVRETDVRYF